jgi:hypothetical protein
MVRNSTIRWRGRSTCDWLSGGDLHAGTAALAVEAGGQVAGKVLPPHGAVRLIDLLQVPLRGRARALQPGAQGAVGDGEAGGPGGFAGVGGAGEVVQAGKEASPGGDGGGDVAGEGVQLAGDGFVAVDAAGAVLAELDVPFRHRRLFRSSKCGSL